MKGILFSIIAGIFISLQGVFNTRMSEDISGWHTTAIVHLVGFILSIIIYLIARDGRAEGFREVPYFYLLGGILGVVIVFGEMTSINLLGMSLAIATILIAQLLCAFIIDTKGLFGMIKHKVSFQQVIGMAMMLVGVILFKW
ncbi:DMT family transporter [Bacillus sp. mrc49]|uniref:DMT family transporter n=1 Tax=Bacillus sp. mrc49 TaxID=2054913 RepID=UPI000C27CF3A|nr:DMT family transporter [Bacillus sp. mrc49]PJN89065.1 EamA-like transporter family protein [Bacillus sp. mrc49]